MVEDTEEHLEGTASSRVVGTRAEEVTRVGEVSHNLARHTKDSANSRIGYAGGYNTGGYSQGGQGGGYGGGQGKPLVDRILA